MWLRLLVLGVVLNGYDFGASGPKPGALPLGHAPCQLVSVAPAGYQPLHFSGVDGSGQVIVPLFPAVMLGIPPLGHID